MTKILTQAGYELKKTLHLFGYVCYEKYYSQAKGKGKYNI
jgi:hypothetical protein